MTPEERRRLEEERLKQSIAGPYIVWTDYGYDGWQPESYPTLEAAVKASRDGLYGCQTVIAKPVKFDVVENHAL